MHIHLARLRRLLPWMTILGSLAALLIPSLQSLTGHLEYCRFALWRGQMWRLLTCHFTHWTPSHLLWDLAVFTVLGWIAERRDALRCRLMLLVSAAAVSGTLFLFLPGMEYYRGLSGLDSALFLYLCADLARGRRSLVPLLPAVFLGLKCLLEQVSGSPLFVTPDPAFIPVPLAHLTGGAVGLAFGLWGAGGEAAAERTKSPASRHDLSRERTGASAVPRPQRARRSIHIPGSAGVPAAGPTGADDALGYCRTPFARVAPAGGTPALPGVSDAFGRALEPLPPQCLCVRGSGPGATRISEPSPLPAISNRPAPNPALERY